MNRIGFTLLCAVLLISCGGAPEDGSAPQTALKQVPRNRTFISDCLSDGCAGQFKDYDSFHPYQPGVTTTTGFNFLYEPLYFYNAYSANGDITPWIAEGHAFNEDYTQVTIRIRPGVEWSDGHPWTAHDLVFTINLLKAHAPTLLFSVDMDKWVKEAVALDDLTAQITLTAPNPRFVFSYFTHNFDNGVPIVPKHIWQDQNPETFKNLDVAKGWPVVTGPYRLAHSTPQQRIYDLREDWWASKIGFQDLPKVERVIYLPRGEEAKRVQSGEWSAEDNPLINAPHTASVIAANEWTHAYSREEAAYPVESLRKVKYWSPVGRVDNVYGDRHLVCTCPPMSEIAEAAE